MLTEAQMEAGEDVMNPIVFEKMWTFIIDNFTDSDSQLLEAYLVLRGITAILQEELGVPDFDVVIDKGEDDASDEV